MILVAWRWLRSADTLLPYSKFLNMLMVCSPLHYKFQLPPAINATRLHYKNQTASSVCRNCRCLLRKSAYTWHNVQFCECQSGGTSSRRTVCPQHAKSSFMSVVLQVAKHAFTFYGQTTQAVRSLRTLVCVTVRCSYDRKGTLGRFRCKLAANRQYDA